MTTILSINNKGKAMGYQQTDLSLAESITKSASRQTYYTIRFLADRERAIDAYRAYAYFRWVDDILDADLGSGSERSAFIQRQKSLLESCYRGEIVQNARIEEQMLVDLIRGDTEKNSGLQSYCRNMMSVMVFDANRRGRIVSQTELSEYTRLLATAVMEAMHYFIGHHCYSPQNEMRYLAVSAAHITHMLRDTFDDLQAGYYNIPREILETNRIAPQDINSNTYRAWVRSRVQLARTYLKAGKKYLSQVENLRCRVAGFAYSARFEWLLDTIERENYCLRPHYNERKSFGTGLQMSWITLSSLYDWLAVGAPLQTVPVRQRSAR
ncbi:MAG: squalene/phytoene synthase family protein [Anaerolineales bacterium]